MISLRPRKAKPLRKMPLAGWSGNRPTMAQIRATSDEVLHEVRHNIMSDQIVSAMVDAELRRREAWLSPSGRAFWLSCAAVIISILSLLVAAASYLTAK